MKKFSRGRVKKVNVITRAQIQNRVVGALLAFIFASTLIYTVVGTAGEFGRFANDAAVLSAKLSVPQGGSEVWADDINYLKGLFAPPKPAGQQSSSQASSSKAASSSPKASSSSKASSSAPAVSKAS
jgi:hypothetical protein